MIPFGDLYLPKYGQKSCFTVVEATQVSLQEHTPVKIRNCWKSHVTAQINSSFYMINLSYYVTIIQWIISSHKYILTMC